jgi:hypothetical protein
MHQGSKQRAEGAMYRLVVGCTAPDDGNAGCLQHERAIFPELPGSGHCLLTMLAITVLLSHIEIIHLILPVRFDRLPVYRRPLALASASRCHKRETPRLGPSSL